MKPAYALRTVKLIHTIIWTFFASCIFGIPVFAVLGKFFLANLLGLIVLVEVLVLVFNRWSCPLTPIAARYTSDRRANFDIYLPECGARHNKTIFGVAYLAGVHRRCVEAGIDLKQGGPDIPESVRKFLNGQPRDIWTLNWVLSVYLHRGYYIYPMVSQIQNVGFDGSGVHFGRSKSKFDYVAPDQPIVRYPDQPVLADELIRHYNSFFGGPKVSLPPVAVPGSGSGVSPPKTRPRRTWPPARHCAPWPTRMSLVNKLI